MGSRNPKLIALVVALAAGAIVYVTAGLFSEATPIQSSQPASAPALPASDASHHDPPSFDAAVPTAAQQAADAIVREYASVVSCDSPEAALERLRAVLTEEIYFQILESRPKVGGATCVSPSVTYTLQFAKGDRGGLRVAALRSDGDADQAVYLEFDARGIVRYLEDPALTESE